MPCSRCGAGTASQLCPRCDEGQSARGGAGWFGTVDRPYVPAGDYVRAMVRKRWGEQARILSGKAWEPGERELYRDTLRSVTIYAIDRHSPAALDCTCIVTDRRLVALDDAGSVWQMRMIQIRDVWSRREFDPLGGASYWVAIGRMGSPVPDRRGDVCLNCTSERQSTRLTALLRELRA